MMASIPGSFNALIALGYDFLTVSATVTRPANSLSIGKYLYQYDTIFFSIMSASRIFGSLDCKTVCI